MKNVWMPVLALCLLMSMAFCASVQRQQEELSSRLVRLHIVADSDSGEAQSRKLMARNAVTRLLEPLLNSCGGSEEARAVIRENIGQIAETARDAAGGQAVTVKLCAESFPAKVYEGFALPAGEYSSLRVTLGGGSGRNWWCVVFPPLCSECGDSDAAFLKLDEDERALIAGKGTVIKFRILELLKRLRALF